MKFNKSTYICLVLFISILWNSSYHKTFAEKSLNITIATNAIKKDEDSEKVKAQEQLKHVIDQGIKNIQKEYIKKYREELNKAEQILEDKTSTVNQIKEEIVRLQKLRASYHEDHKKNPIDTTDELTSLKKTLRKRTEEEIDLENYTENSTIDYINAKKYAKDMLQYPLATVKDVKEAISEYDKVKKSLVKVKTSKAYKNSKEALAKLLKIAKSLDLNKVSNSASKNNIEKMIRGVQKIVDDDIEISEDKVRINYKNLAMSMTNVLHVAKNEKYFTDENLIKSLQRIERLDIARLSQESAEQLYHIFEYGIESYEISKDQKSFDERTKKVNRVIDNLAYVKKRLPIAGVEKESMISIIAMIFLVIGIYCTTRKVTN